MIITNLNEMTMEEIEVMHEYLGFTFDLNNGEITGSQQEI
jgi:hypothetical protein